jgi:hypothetical protein
MVLDIVTGESEKSYGVVPTSMLALTTASPCAADGGDVTQAFMGCRLAGSSGRFFQFF